MRKPIALVAALLLATSLAAGCGGDDSGDDSSSPTVAANGGDDGTTTTVDADATTTTAADGSDATDAPTGGANPDSDYCHAAQAFTSDPDLAAADANVFSDPELTAHAVDLLTAMHDAAPDDLQDDLQTFIDAFQAVGAALSQAGDDPAAQQAALAGIQDQFTDLQAASSNVETFTQSECGIDVNDTGDAGTG